MKEPKAGDNLPGQNVSAIEGLFRNSLVYLVSNVSSAAIPFLLLPFLTRKLGSSEYGQVGIFFALVSVLTALVTTGTIAYIRKSYIQNSEKERSLILGSCIQIAVASSITLLSIVYLSKELIVQVLGFNAELMYLALFSAIAQFLINVRLATWQMQEKSVRYGSILIFSTATNLTLSLVLIFVYEMGWLGRAYGFLIPTSAIGFFCLAAMIFGKNIIFSFDRGRIKTIVSYGLPLIPHAVAGSILIFFERATLSDNSGVDQAGIYFAAYQLSLPLSILINSINLQFKPWGYKKMAQGAHFETVRASYAIMTLFLAAACIYAIILLFTFELIVGQEMKHGITASLILIASAMFKGFYLVVSKGLLFAGATRVFMYTSVVSTIIFCLCVHQLRTIEQVAMLNCAYNIIVFLVIWYFANKKYPQPWFKALKSLNRQSLSRLWR